MAAGTTCPRPTRRRCSSTRSPPCCSGCWAGGSGPTLGIALAYAWAAFPFTLFTLNSNSNDSLVAALVVATLLVAHRPMARGATAALTGLTKFAPLALAPMLWTYRDPEDPRPQWRTMSLFAVAFAVTAAIVLLPAFLGSGFETFLDRTVRFQDDRGSPFSVWGFLRQSGGSPRPRCSSPPWDSP